jgi:HD-GYP domain-containing protein (c-di-GMP phosphodiesterase class II)
LALAQQLGITDKRYLHDLGVGALLHDVGKSRVSNSILNKHGSLTDREFEIIKHHPKWGAEILSDTDELNSTSYYPVLQHHERCDGGGYPGRFLADDIHPTAKIVAIADSFDAMTTDRVYQKATETYPVLRLMFGLGESYDRDYLRAFAELMGPTGLG